MQQAQMGYMHDTFWHNDQVILTFYSDKGVTEFTRDSATEFLEKHLVNLNKFLENRSSLTLRLFRKEDTQRSTREAPRSTSEAEKSSEPGIYLFNWPAKPLPSIPMTKAGVQIRTGLVGIFYIHEVHSGQHDMADASMDGPSNVKIGPVASIVNLLNGYVARSNNVNSADYVPIHTAGPVFYSGATGDIPQGCPVSPPIPVPVGVSCPSSPGFFPLEFSPGLQPGTIGDSGYGVTVCILDTLPKREQITRAAQTAGENNKLLLDVEKNVKFCYDYDQLVNAVDKSGRLAVGKDIYGRHGHFNLSDHGLFVAGIVRSLASKASIECIRVLNDFCVGDMNVLLRALQDIHNRMLPGGNLYRRPVVISMSLVIPTDEEAQQMGIELNPVNRNMIRASLFGAIESMAELGAIFVASAGNERDIRDNPSGKTPKPLFPAAFADDDALGIISVGSTDSTGKPTTYSCFPGLNGIAVYGGELSKAISSSGCFTKATVTDALIGIYSSPSYPSLSIDDCEPNYSAPNSNCWAYWAGTSFATPIISGVLARMLQIAPLSPNRVATLVPISNAVAASPLIWTNLDPITYPGGSGTEFLGRMILVKQCKGEATVQG